MGSSMVSEQVDMKDMMVQNKPNEWSILSEIQQSSTRGDEWQRSYQKNVVRLNEDHASWERLIDDLVQVGVVENGSSQQLPKKVKEGYGKIQPSREIKDQ